jgi:hypothetical protein
MDDPTALQKAGFKPKTPHGLRHRTNITIDTSQFISSYIPPNTPSHPHKSTSLGPEEEVEEEEEEEEDEDEKDKNEEIFDDETLADRKKGIKRLGVKIRALIDRYPPHDMIRVNLDKGVVRRWELRVWTASAHKSNVIDAYKKKIEKELERLDVLEDSWYGEDEGEGTAGHKVFRKAVKLLMMDGEEVAFATPTPEFGVRNCQPVVPMRTSKYSGNVDTTEVAPEFTTDSDKEAALNAENFNRDLLSNDDLPRWRNRQEIQKALRDLKEGIADTDPYKLLDITEFASALETKAWEEQTDEPDSYKDRVIDVLLDLDVWQTLWDSEEADEGRQMTGYQMFKELVYKIIVVDSNYDESSPQKALDDELADLGGWTSDADGLSDTDYDNTGFSGDKNLKDAQPSEANAATLSSDQNAMGGLSANVLEGQEVVQISPASPSPSEQGPTGKPVDMPEDYPINSETAPHYEWPPSSYDNRSPPAVLPPAVPGCAWPTDESHSIWPADDPDDTFSPDFSFDDFLADTDDLAAGPVGAGAESVPIGIAVGFQDAGLSTSLVHNAASTSEQTSLDVLKPTSDATTAVAAADTTAQDQDALPLLLAPVLAFVQNSNHGDFQGVGEQSHATVMQTSQAVGKSQQVFSLVLQQPLPPFALALSSNTIEATPNATNVFGPYKSPRDAHVADTSLYDVNRLDIGLDNVQMGDSCQTPQHGTAGAVEATHPQSQTTDVQQQQQQQYELDTTEDDSMYSLFNDVGVETFDDQQGATIQLAPFGAISVTNPLSTFNTDQKVISQYPQGTTANPFNLGHLPGFGVSVSSASRPTLFDSIGLAQPAAPVPADFGWRPSNAMDVISANNHALQNGATDDGPNHISTHELTKAIDVPSAITSNLSTSTQADSIMNDAEVQDNSYHEYGEGTTAPSPATSSDPPPLFMTHNLNFGMPVEIKLFAPQTKFVIDFGADTADLSKLKQDRVTPQVDLPGSSAISGVTEGQQAEPLAGGFEFTIGHVGIEAGDDPTDDLTAALAAQFLLKEESPEPRPEPHPSQAPSEFAQQSVGAIQATPHVPPPMPQTEVSTAQVEMVMNDQAKKYQDLVARLETMNIMMFNLREAGIQGEKEKLSDLASGLEKDVAEFGKLTEQDVVQKLSQDSGMATKPEEEGESVLFAEEASKDVVSDQEIHNLALRFGIDVLNDKILRTQPPVAEETDFGTSLQIELPFRTKATVHVEDSAGQTQKQEVRESEGEALRLHRQNPTQQPTIPAKNGDRSTRIERYINDWYFKTQHGVPEAIFEYGEALIDAFHDVDESNSRRDPKELLSQVNQWVTLRKMVAAYRKVQDDFEGAACQSLEQDWAAYNASTPDSQESSKLLRCMKQKLFSLAKHYKELLNAVENLKKRAPEIIETEALVEMLDRTVIDSRNALRIAYNKLEARLPNSLVVSDLDF